MIRPFYDSLRLFGHPCPQERLLCHLHLQEYLLELVLVSKKHLDFGRRHHPRDDVSLKVVVDLMMAASITTADGPVEQS